jgi:regulator of protease activity HflC (stomatin/prohibitin superfamily)
MAEGNPFANPSKKMIISGIVVIAVIILISKMLVIIPSGHVGVKVFFGKVQSETLDEGIHIINPIIKVSEMSVRTQQISETANVPSQEGLVVNLDLSILFSLDPRQAATVYRTIGPNYIEIVVIPQIRSVVRGATAGYDAKALYTAERELIANQMGEQLRPMLKDRGIIVEKVMLRSVKLPDILSTAIERKLEAEQQAEQMKFVLDREKSEAERKRIEAKGISDYNLEVTKGLSDSILRLRGIEATKDLAKSENAKIVVVGGKDGLPLIFGGH